MRIINEWLRPRKRLNAIQDCTKGAEAKSTCPLHCLLNNFYQLLVEFIKLRMRAYITSNNKPAFSL